MGSKDTYVEGSGMQTHDLQWQSVWENFLSVLTCKVGKMPTEHTVLDEEIE